MPPIKMEHSTCDTQEVTSLELIQIGGKQVRARSICFSLLAEIWTLSLMLEQEKLLNEKNTVTDINKLYLLIFGYDWNVSTIKQQPCTF